MIIILEKDKITQEIKHKLLNKGLRLIGMSDKEIIFYKLKSHFLHWCPMIIKFLILLNSPLLDNCRWKIEPTRWVQINECRQADGPISMNSAFGVDVVLNIMSNKL